MRRKRGRSSTSDAVVCHVPDGAFTLSTPLLSGSRARALLAQLPADLDGAVVHLRCDQLVAAGASFADEIVNCVLVEGRARSLELSDDSAGGFSAMVRGRALAHGVVDRVQVRDR